ncbi:MAG TPA: DegQ family serine endoprotease [Candidatus Sulfotelmatobacter sp.]|nr:DegQ family serine endoprotease [Candidatus Sulfotelmatobacter sp.]
MTPTRCRRAVLLSVGALTFLLTVPPVALPATPEARTALQALQDAFVSVAQAVKPAVVNIATTQRPKRSEGRRTPQPPSTPRGPFRDFFGEDFFERFFGEQAPRERHSLGSGVIVDSRGYILTNNHVIEQADQIEVRLSDRRKFQATVIGRDPKTDLAVIKIDAAGDLPVAKLGQSARIRIGEWAIAIGNPFGLDQTVTVGVISAVGRSDVGITTYEDFIQTDASINPGNSGGPLVNLEGEVIGINTAIVAAGQGIGFAIPVDMAKQISERLIGQGRVVRAWLGVGIQELTDELAAQFGVRPEDGVLVGNVMKDSPAERAGLKTGDILQEFDGVAITNVHQLQREVAQRATNSTVKIRLLRERQPLTVSVVLGEQPSEMAETPGAPPTPAEPAQRYGFSVQDLTPELRTQLNLAPGATGVVVAGVEEDSPAARAGVRAGDLITQANREPIASAADVTRVLTRLRSGGNLLLLVQRNGGSRFVVLQPARE